MAARGHGCREELRLNARLASGVYLGLLALRWQYGALPLPLQIPDAGCLPWTWPGTGQTLDGLVLIQRPLTARRLDRRVAVQQVRPTEIDALAECRIDFYRQATPVRIVFAERLARQ